MNEFTLEQVIRFARSSNLRNSEVINSYEDIVNIVNLVLIELHSRFLIRQNVVEIPLERDKSIYDILDYIKDIGGNDKMTEVELLKVKEDVLKDLEPKLQELANIAKSIGENSIKKQSYAKGIFLNTCDFVIYNNTIYQAKLPFMITGNFETDKNNLVNYSSILAKG